jgi:hypothetical protein
MLRIGYTSSFLREYKKLILELKEEVKEKLDILSKGKNLESLKIHKLHGQFKGCHSMSVNYSFRIIFRYEDKNNITFLKVGSHEIYK